MLNFIFAGVVLVLVCSAAEPMPDKITVDMNGIRWVDKNGTDNFYKTDAAWSVTGAIPWVHTIVCERSDGHQCREPYKAYPECREWPGYCATICVEMNCVPIPFTDKIKVIYPDIRFEQTIVETTTNECDPSSWLCMERTIGKYEDVTTFSPEDFVLDIRAADSLSLLWHIN
jgi:hypothetical protein